MKLDGPKNVWNTHTEDFTPRHTKYTPQWGRVMLYAYLGAGQVDFDDVIVKQIAPPPTGAAEMALPVRSELIANIASLSGRMSKSLMRHVERSRLELKSAAGRLPRVESLLQQPRQRLDLASQRFGGSLSRMVSRKRQRFDKAAGGLRPAALRREVAQKRGEVDRLGARLAPAMTRRIQRLREYYAAQARVLDSVSYERVLARGFALVSRGGALVRSASAIAEGDALKLRFADGEIDARAGNSAPLPKKADTAKGAAEPPAPAEQPPRPRIRRPKRGSDQGDLF